MKILIPTAKQMKERNEKERKGINNKTFKVLESILKVDDLSKFFKIKGEQAKIEKKRFEEIRNNIAKEYSAIDLFDGLMYRNIKRENLNDLEWKYLDNIYITSSFYGVINCKENISLHRLDFLNNLDVDGISLKKYWQENFDKSIENEKIVISLLSSEFEEVFSKELREKMIKIVFKDDGKIHSTISKKARGKFLTTMIEKNVMKIEDIKKLEFDGYKLTEEKDNILIFER